VPVATRVKVSSGAPAQVDPGLLAALAALSPDELSTVDERTEHE
jgi:hypothetical protein